MRFVGKDHPAGPGGTSMQAHLLKKLAAAGIEPSRVVFTGAVPHSELPQIYGESSICLVPSLYENFPYTCLEAMASGCAVIASRTGGIPEIIQDGVDGLLVPPGDVEALANAIIRLMSHPQEVESIAARARASVQSRFGKAAISQRTAKLYRAVMSSRGVRKLSR